MNHPSPAAYRRRRRRYRFRFRPQLLAVLAALLALALIASVLLIALGQPPEHYTYARAVKDMKALAKQHENCSYHVLGQSVLGQDIPMLSIGDADAPVQVLIVGATHARENITARLAVAQAKDLLENGQTDYLGQTFEEWVENIRLDIVPVLNPDGMRLCTEGVGWIRPASARKEFIAQFGTDLALWKANGRGVDLNSNYDADWELIDSEKVPGPEGYKGLSPVSEPENMAIVQLIEQNEYDALLSYHTRGEVIFWYYHQEGEQKARDLAFAEAVARETGYALVDEATSAASMGGLKDWFVQKYARPALTLEMGVSGLSYPFTEEEYIKKVCQRLSVTNARTTRHYQGV